MLDALDLVDDEVEMAENQEVALYQIVAPSRNVVWQYKQQNKPLSMQDQHHFFTSR